MSAALTTFYLTVRLEDGTTVVKDLTSNRYLSAVEALLRPSGATVKLKWEEGEYEALQRRTLEELYGAL